MKVACIEKENTLGGTCLNVGCIPSKALLSSTELLSSLKHKGNVNGIQGELHVDFAKMMKRKEEVVAGLVKGVEHEFKAAGVIWIKGECRFTSETTVAVGSEHLTSKYFLLASGSAPLPLSFLPFDEKVVLSSTGALALKSVPETMLIIGAGAIGLEIGSVYNRLGTKVHVVEMLDRICPLMDEAVSKSLRTILQKQGLVFSLCTKVENAKLQTQGLTLHLEGKETLYGDVVLVAIGRAPYTKNLGLEKIGVTFTPRGFIEVDSDLRTKVPTIFAVGDVIGGAMLAHKAYAEGVAVVEKLAGIPSRVNYAAIPSVIYTSPEAVSVGFTEEEAKKAGFALKIGTSYFRGNPRARCSGEEEGMCKVIGDAATGVLLGLHMVGPYVSEMIGEGVIAIEKKVTLAEIAHAPHTHPNYAEVIKEACQLGF